MVNRIPGTYQVWNDRWSRTYERNDLLRIWHLLQLLGTKRQDHMLSYYESCTRDESGSRYSKIADYILKPPVTASSNCKESRVQQWRALMSPILACQTTGRQLVCYKTHAIRSIRNGGGDDASGRRFVTRRWRRGLLSAFPPFLSPLASSIFVFLTNDAPKTRRFTIFRRSSVLPVTVNHYYTVVALQQLARVVYLRLTFISCLAAYASECTRAGLGHSD